MRRNNFETRRVSILTAKARFGPHEFTKNCSSSSCGPNIFALRCRGQGYTFHAYREANCTLAGRIASGDQDLRAG